MTKSFNIKSKPAAMSAEEFRVLLARKNMSNEEAAEILDVHRNTISHWINDKHPISLPYSFMIRHLLEDKPSQDQATMTPEEFRMLLARLNLTYIEAAEKLGMHRNTINDWANGKTRITPAAVALIEKILGR